MGVAKSSMVARVYSYTRFSDPSQAAGSSADRQASYAAKWAQEHGLHLDTELSMRDEGLSAYHQHHVKAGAFGVFLEAIEQGRVPRGSVLVVESLDRLSRAEPILAQAQLAKIIHAGISVVTAADGKVYSREKLRDQPMDLVYSLLVMIRAHEESDTKAKRVSAAIVRLCQGWQAGIWRGKVHQGRDPAWLRETPEGWELVPERAAAVREAVRLYLAGNSGQQILTKLAAQGLKMTAGADRSTTIYKRLANPALVGTKVVTVGTETFELAGYYPALLTLEQWQDLRAAGSQRGRRGSPGLVPHVITGLGITYCGYCGCAMSGQNLYGKQKHVADKLQPGYRRLLCAGQSYASGRCPFPTSRSVAPVERAIMDYCSDVLNLRALYPADRATPLRQALAELRQQAATVATQVERLVDVITSTAAEGSSAALARRLRDLEAEQARLAGQIDTAEQALAAAQRGNLDGVEQQWAALREGVMALDADARLQARQLVADTFERIEVFATGLDPTTEDDYIDVILRAKGGVGRLLRITPTKGDLVAAETLEG